MSSNNSGIVLEKKEKTAYLSLGPRAIKLTAISGGTNEEHLKVGTTDHSPKVTGTMGEIPE